MVFSKMCQCTALARKFVQLMNMLFNKVHCENGKCLLVLLKTEQTFWPAQDIGRVPQIFTKYTINRCVTIW